MSNRRDNQFTYSPHNKATVVDCSFVVDSMNGNGLGIRSLKRSGRVYGVRMQQLEAAPSPPVGSPNLATSATFALLAASTITNTGSSVITGNLGLYAGTSVTGFPPGTVSGIQYIADGVADQAKIDATAAYNDISVRPATAISADLDGQTLTPGVYKETTGTFNLATSGNATLTLNGAGLYIFQASSTLTTGAGGTPTILLTGGATAANVYWAVGSSATINVSDSGVFEGTIIAHTSITIDGGSVVGRLLANTGAVTISAATNVALPAGSVPTPAPVAGNPAAGLIVVQLDDNYNRYLGGYSGYASPLNSTPISSGLIVGNPYVIVSLGSSTLAQWRAAGLYSTLTPAVGVSFIAAATSVAGGGLVEGPALSGSGIDHIEVLGDANQMNWSGPYFPGLTPNVPVAAAYPGSGTTGPGMSFILACYNGGQLTAPNDNTVIGLNFYLNNTAQGV